MADNVLVTADQVQKDIGRRLQRLRIRMGRTQTDLSKMTGVSPRALQNLEAGNGSSLDTFVKVLLALGQASSINLFVPVPGIDPMALLKLGHEQKRVRRKAAKQ